MTSGTLARVREWRAAEHDKRSDENGAVARAVGSWDRARSGAVTSAVVRNRRGAPCTGCSLRPAGQGDLSAACAW